MKAIKLRAKTYTEAAQAAAAHFTPGVAILQVCHDDGCPAIRTQRDADCAPPCKPDFFLVKPFEGRQR